MTLSPLQRKVKLIDPELDGDQSQFEFKEFLARKYVILLGDPGSGKTHTFNNAADFENANYFPIKNFIAINGINCTDKVLYLDALDEYRSRTSEDTIINSLFHILGRIGNPSFRLSCRVSDWLGDTDLSRFRTLFNQNDYAVLQLEPLTDEEIISILTIESIYDPESFLREAEKRGLDNLLSNPQTLIMLANVLKDGNWPQSKVELFEMSISKLLTEHNKDRMRDDIGQYNAEELIEPAGAVCTSLLVSGLRDISLLPNANNTNIPSYRDIPYDSEKVLSSLLKRCFTGLNDEIVSYSHRTIAEYLSAKWFAIKHKNGLPVNRIHNLLCVDGKPTPELRGLYAWIASIITEQRIEFYKNDPFGILMYGDVSSFNFEDRLNLLHAIEDLSKDDPWFRSHNWTDHPLGALSKPDMTNAFKEILSNPNSTYHLKTLVLDAISNGTQLPDIKDDLLRIISNNNTDEYERYFAFKALVHAVPDGLVDIVTIFRNDLSKHQNSSHLRIKFLSRNYEGWFTPTDVISTISDFFKSDEQYPIGALYNLSHSLTLTSLPDILDGLSKLNETDEHAPERHNEFDVEHAFSRMLKRVLESDITIKADRLFTWLKCKHWFKDMRSLDSEDDYIKEWLENHKFVIFEMFELEYKKYDLNIRWNFHYDFLDITMHALTNEDFVDYCFKLIENNNNITERELQLYRFCGGIARNIPPPNKYYDIFCKMPNNHSSLSHIRDELTVSIIEDWRRNEIEYKKEQQQNKKNSIENSKIHFTKNINLIKNGKDKGSLTWLADLYFGHFTDTDKDLSPLNRLKDELGDELAFTALNGFRSLLSQPNLPPYNELYNTLKQGHYYRFWYAILAGIYEDLEYTHIENYDDDLLKFALTIHYELLLHSNDNDFNLKTIILEKRKDIVKCVFKMIIEDGFKNNHSHISVLYDFCNLECIGNWKHAFALQILLKYTISETDNLKCIICTAVYDTKNHNKIIDNIEALFRKKKSIDNEHKSLYLSLGLLLDFDKFKILLSNHSEHNDEFVWYLKYFVENLRINNPENRIELSIEQLEFMIEHIAAWHDNIDHPNHAWSGKQNPWDASQFTLNLINTLSSIPYQETTNALERLSKNIVLDTYHNNINHAIANQLENKRQHLYQQPTWKQVINFLKFGKPINIVDLRDLVLDHLKSYKKEVLTAKTDKYKAYWNCDSYNRILEPKAEEHCRDRLIDHLNDRFNSLDLRLEPEGHMVNDKRADINVIYSTEIKLPIEIKRDHHDDLWNAMISQLDKKYTIDPEAQGYGIYLVYWFGDKRKTSIPKPPIKILIPTTAEELEKALNSLIPDDKKEYLSAIVIDVYHE